MPSTVAGPWQMPAVEWMMLIYLFRRPRTLHLGPSQKRSRKWVSFCALRHLSFGSGHQEYMSVFFMHEQTPWCWKPQGFTYLGNMMVLGKEWLLRQALSSPWKSLPWAEFTAGSAFSFRDLGPPFLQAAIFLCFKLESDYFRVLCSFLLSGSVNQACASTHLLPVEPPSHTIPPLRVITQVAFCVGSLEHSQGIFVPKDAARASWSNSPGHCPEVRRHCPFSSQVVTWKIVHHVQEGPAASGLSLQAPTSLLLLFISLGLLIPSLFSEEDLKLLSQKLKS